MTTSALPIDVFVEEWSAKVACEVLLPKLRPDLAFSLHDYNGKQALLDKLPHRLKGISKIPGTRALILVEEDREDCAALKAQLCAMVTGAKLIVASAHPKHPVRGQVFVRVVVEELEAWFFGDVPALCAAYPKLSPSLAQKRSLRDPDAIKGGTWEALERELQRVGYFASGLRKAELAEAVAPHMNPALNRSKSFQHFCNALQAL